jgi:O-antigen/teichoic acid export membrane protein
MSSSLWRNTFHLLLGQIGTMVLGLLFSAVLGRTLGAGDFGTWFLISTFAAFALVVVDWGQQFFGIREVARAPGRGGELLGTGLVLRAIGTALICIPAGLTAWALGYGPRVVTFTLGLVALSLPFFLAQNFGVVFRGNDRMGLDALVSVANRAVGLCLAVLALGLGLGLGGVVASQGLAGLAALGLAFLLYRRHTSAPIRFSTGVAREILVGGSAIVTMTIVVNAQPYLDAVVLSKLAPQDAVGWYGAAKTILGTLLAPSVILGTAAFPRLSRAAGDVHSFSLELSAAERPMLWLGGLASVGTWSFASVAIQLVYGQRHFGPAAQVLAVFGLSLFLVFVDVLLGNALVALGRATAFSVLKMVMVVIGTLLELWLIPRFQAAGGNGGLGVATSFVVCEFAIFSGMVMLFPRGTLGRALFVDGARALGCALGTAGILHLAAFRSPWLAIPACVLIYAALSRATGLVRSDDVQRLRRRVLRALGRSEVPPVVEPSP